MIIKCNKTAWIQCISLCATMLLISWAQVAQAKDDPQSKVVDSLRSETFEVYFTLGSSEIDPSLMDNQSRLKKLSKSIEKHKDLIKSIELNASASPDGKSNMNKELAKSRAESIQTFLKTLPIQPGTQIIVNNLGIDWARLERLVRARPFTYRNEVLEILENVPEQTWAKKNPTDRWESLVDSRNHQLMNLRGGNPYNYMLKHLFPSLRSVNIVTIYYNQDPTKIVEKTIVEKVVDTVVVNRDVEKVIIEKVTDTVVVYRDIEPAIEPVGQDNEYKKDLFALKTNLLFDAISVINAEIEVPIGNRWSIAGEFAFPWWTMDNSNEGSKRNRLQAYNGNLEGKYWFGKRADRPKMTGWFAGLYVGAGLFDMEYDTEGYQSDLFLMGGLSGGYAHTINKKGNLRMEYSLGIGYMQTDYSYYKSHYDESYVSPDNPDSPHWHPVRQYTSRLKWIGPTKLKVSLVWMLNSNTKKRGAK